MLSENADGEVRDNERPADMTVAIQLNNDESTSVDRTIRVNTVVDASITSSHPTSQTEQKTRFNIFRKNKGRTVHDVIERTQSHRIHGRIENGIRSDANFTNVNEQFQFIRELAEGIRDTISVGKDLTLNRRVSIKTLREVDDPEVNEQHRQTFITEAEITAQLEHPSIIPVYGICSDGKNGLHLINKLIDGQTFQQYLRQICTHYRLDGIKMFNEHQSLLFRLEVLLHVCDAMEYAHSRDIMHGDLKPEHIMIGEYHETYVKGWSLARPIKDSSSNPMTWKTAQKVSGTPAYLSPEAAAGRYCDHRSDIYALGLILFEAITLQEAFTGNSTDEILHQIRSGHFPPIEHRFGYPISKDLKAIVYKACAYDRNDRYQSVHDFAQDVRHYLNDEPVSVRKQTLFSTCLRTFKRHQTAVVIIFAMLVTTSTLSVSLGVSRNYSKTRSEFQQEQVLSKLYANAAIAAHDLDTQLEKIKQNVLGLRSEIYDVLAMPVPKKDDLKKFPPELYPGEDYPGAFQTTAAYSPVYGTPIHLDYFAVIRQEKESKKRDLDQIRKLARLRNLFARFMITSPASADLTIKNVHMLRNDLLIKGTPILKIDVILENGSILSYPFRQGPYDNSDLRNAAWYQNIKKSGADTIFWTPPIYQTFTGYQPMKPVFLANMALYHPDNHEFFGVLSVAFSIPFIQKTIEANSSKENKSLIGRYLIAADGTIMVADSPLAMMKERDWNRKLHPPIFGKFLPDNLFKLIRAKKNGSLKKWENGKSVVYCFAALAPENWIYVEKIDLNAALNQINRKPVPAKGGAK